MTSYQRMPYSLEGERGLLGCILKDPALFLEYKEKITPESFYIIRHKWIWQAFINLNEKNIPINVQTVTEECKRLGVIFY